jgi:hypothetical protein
MNQAINGILGLVYSFIGLGGVVTYWDDPLAAFLLGGPWVVWGAVMLRGMWRVATITDGSGLEARWLLRKRRIPWSEIAAFDTARVPDGPVLAWTGVAHLHNGDIVRVPVPGRRQHIIDALNDDLAHWKARARPVGAGEA